MIVPSPLETSTAKVVGYWLIDVNQRQPGMLNFNNLRDKRGELRFYGYQPTKSHEFRSLTAKDAKSAKKIDSNSKYILY